MQLLAISSSVGRGCFGGIHGARGCALWITSRAFLPSFMLRPLMVLASLHHPPETRNVHAIPFVARLDSRDQVRMQVRTVHMRSETNQGCHCVLVHATWLLHGVTQFPHSNHTKPRCRLVAVGRTKILRMKHACVPRTRSSPCFDKETCPSVCD